MRDIARSRRGRGDRAELEAAIRRLTKSGAMAEMREALASCPDAGRKVPDDAELLDNPEHMAAQRLLVDMARAELR